MTFDDWWVQHQDTLTRFANLFLRNREDSQDAVSDAYLICRRNIRGHHEGQWKQYAHRAVRHRCVDLIRSAARRRDVPLEEAAGSGHEWGRGVDARLDVELGLGELPEYADILWLADVEGERAKDGAAALGISRPAYKSRLYRGRRALQRRLGAGYCESQ